MDQLVVDDNQAVENGSVLEPLGKKGPKIHWGRMIDDSQKIASEFYYSYMPEMRTKAIEVCVPGHFAGPGGW